MHLQPTQSAGPAVQESLKKNAEESLKQFLKQSSSLPFGQNLPLPSIGGPTYVTPQALVQQVAYTLSDKIFTYSPETFDLDVAVKEWSSQHEHNAFGYAPGVSTMQTRTGAGSIALGYIFSTDFDLKKRHIPQSVIASSSSLNYMRAVLDQLALLYSVASPLVAHVAAVDYSVASESGLVTDYCSALTLADELGLALVSSASAYEIQHMALFATLLSSLVPSIHTYDGLTVGRETMRIVDALDRPGLCNIYQTILKVASGTGSQRSDIDGNAVQLLRALNDELGTEYKLFEYHGHAAPEAVLVVFGTVEASLTSQVVKSLSTNGFKVGVINVRVYRPFVEEEFVAVLPKSASTVAVLGQVKDNGAVEDESQHSLLYKDVLAAVSFSLAHSNLPRVVDVKYARDEVWTPRKVVSTLSRIEEAASGQEPVVDILGTSVRQYTFWDVDDSASVTAPLVLGRLLSADSSSNVSVRTGHDNLVQGGVIRTDIRSSSKSIEASYSVDDADFAYVGEEKLLWEFDILNNIKPGGTLLARLPGIQEDQLEKRLPVGLRKGLFSKNIALYAIDPSASTKTTENSSLESYLLQLGFLRLALPELYWKGHQKLAAINGSIEVLDGLSEELVNVVQQIAIPESWATVEPEVEGVSLPTDISVNSFAAFERVDPEPPALLKTWATAAKGLAFKEAYGTKSALRPDLGIKTSVVYVKERRRLTPLSYDRNIFHIEFDLADSGLTYAIGEALGIHAENNATDVEEFIKWYGLNPNEIVEVPSREDPNVLENRTVYQALLQNIDIFGRPPKRFYEALAGYASDEKEKESLLTLSTAEGATEFKRRAEVDTVTYADILLEYPSAHPYFHDIVRIVAPLKRREYSIASSQKVTPNSVSLLIVTVGWVDPKGRDRFGLATRYLNDLLVGAPVTVSVKPSVMKLPPSPKAPIIMAGLGTGLAPFRAFVQERARQKMAGEEIGAVMLYMGSRHQREEYLYGEEWEAYRDAGVITLLGQAFSRDQPHKIYIQDRMRQTMDQIRQAYLREGGSFYLCGPTWPVPDVTEVLMEAMELEAKESGKKVDKRREIDTLKEAGRYVLEVY